MKMHGPNEFRKCVALPACRAKAAYIVLPSSLALGVLILVSTLLSNIPGLWGKERIVLQPAQAAPATFPMQAVSGTGTYTNCRFGVGQAHQSITSYDIAPLNLGWYGNWGTSPNPPKPQGIEYVQTLHVSDGASYNGREHPGPLSYSPSGSALEAIITANPGSLWLVGNEPDCIWQSNVLPQNYAQIYHDAYNSIKEKDPTAQVAVGGIVQPTPLRVEYLETVLDTYASLYSEPLPTDAWHIHSFILREVDCRVYPNSCWGCEIPPGSTAEHGELYEVEQTDDLNIFRQRLTQFRQWMRDRGYRDKPLIITEYGTLIPHTYGGWDEERGRDFMYGTFDFLLTESGPTTGYPSDENRLVQRWLWYSLDDDGYGGTLFDRYEPPPYEILPMGTYYSDYTSAISPTTDLLAVDVRQITPIPLAPTGTATITLEARVSNPGNSAITAPVTIRFLDGSEQPIGADQVISQTIAGCADTHTVTIVWPNLAPDAYSVKVVVDPLNTINEANEGNNEAYGIVMVAKKQYLLPMVYR